MLVRLIDRGPSARLQIDSQREKERRKLRERVTAEYSEMCNCQLPQFVTLSNEDAEKQNVDNQTSDRHICSYKALFQPNSWKRKQQLTDLTARGRI